MYDCSGRWWVVKLVVVAWRCDKRDDDGGGGGDMVDIGARRWPGGRKKGLRLRAIVVDASLPPPTPLTRPFTAAAAPPVRVVKRDAARRQNHTPLSESVTEWLLVHRRASCSFISVDTTTTTTTIVSIYSYIIYYVVIIISFVRILSIILFLYEII